VVTTWRVTVGPECIAAGSCLGIAPDRFALGEDGRSHPVRDQVEPDESVLDSAASCPMEAIGVFNAATGERIEPG
jgi:ferredoxin